MKITRRQLKHLVEVEVKLSDEELNAARDEIEQQGGAVDSDRLAQAVRTAAGDDSDEKLSDEEITSMVVDQADDISQHPAGDIVDTDALNERDRVARNQLIKIIKEELAQIAEGEVVDMFSGDQTKQNAVERIARALAARAEEMLDADGDGDDVAVHVDHKLFLSPYTDIDGDGREVRPLAQSVYEDYVSRKAGDQAESLDSIIERISIDYFDEPIEYALEALGDDRWTMPDTYFDEEEQMMTSPVSGDSDEDWIYDVEGEMEAKMQGIESGDIVELEPDDDLAESNLSEGVMVPLTGIGNSTKRHDTMAGRWSRIAGLDRFNEQYQPRDPRLEQVNTLLDDALELVGRNNRAAADKVEDASEIMDGEADQGAVEQVRRLGDKQTIIDLKNMANSEGFSFPPD
jgi:hypothetical protein